MHSRFAWMLAIICLVITVAVAAFFSGGVPTLRRVQVRMTPREDDGTQVAVDFLSDLAAGRHESAWDRTAVAYRQETDYDGFVEFSNRYFGTATTITIDAGEAGAVICRIGYPDRPATAVHAEVEMEDGYWRVRDVTWGE